MPGLSIHREANQIGGCCAEIASGGGRILIGLGASLPDTAPAIEDGNSSAGLLRAGPGTGGPPPAGGPLRSGRLHVLYPRRRQKDPVHRGFPQRALDWLFPGDGSKEARLIYSLRTGYLRKRKHPDRTMLAAPDSRDLSPLHASGHAPVETLARLMDLVEPSLIIPMHTEYARRFQELPEFARWQPRVRLVRDRETLAL